MSKIITEISAPVLNDSNFGNNLKEQFENINNNFKILASAEFMKGAEGKTIKLSEVPAFKKNTEGKYIFTSLGAKLFSTILGITINENDSLNEIKNLIETEEDSYKQWAKLSTSAKYSVFDSFKTGDDEYDGTINLYSYEDEEKYIYSPMNYFRDARIDELNDSESDVSNFSDASCSYIYDGEKFKTYTLYPTLYYNSTLGLICWKVNGEETSIAAQGLKGKDGNTCSVHILRCSIIEPGEDLMSIQATQYFYPGKDESWYEINEVVSIINNNEDTKYKKISDIFGKTDLYFCIIDDIYDYTFANYPSIDDDGTVKFIVDNSALIGRKAFINNFRDMVNNFNHNAGDGYPNAASLKGFYLPFTNDKKLVHSIYVSSDDKLNIDVESKDIYTNVDGDKGEIEKSSINIKNHDVKIEGGDLNANDVLLVEETNVTLQDVEDFNITSKNVKVTTTKETANIKEIEIKSDKITLQSLASGDQPSLNINIENFDKIEVGNDDYTGNEPDKYLTIHKDTEVNMDTLNDRRLILKGTGEILDPDYNLNLKYIGVSLENTNSMRLYDGSVAGYSADSTVNLSGGLRLSRIVGNSEEGYINILNYHNLTEKKGDKDWFSVTFNKNTLLRAAGGLHVSGTNPFTTGQSPKSSLSVTGSAYISKSLEVDESILLYGGMDVKSGNIAVANGKVSASSGFYQSSDERLKNFEGDIEIDFDKLKKIPKKYFTWKNDDKLHIGTSAQEVQKVYPEIVSGDDTLSVNYDKLGVIALKAIDILHDDLEELKKENNELKAKNDELESRLAKLEALLLNK